MSDLIERETVIEAVKNYGKKMISAGRETFDTVDNIVEMVRMIDALPAALHRAEPEMRPLTMVEVKAHCAKGLDAEPLWVEYDTVRDMALWVLANTPYGMDERDIPSLAYWLKDEELVSEYWKFWRCWPRKPTSEQMAAEKWEE